MIPLAGKTVIVLGRDPSGQAATALLRRRGARVECREVDPAGPPEGPEPDLVVTSARSKAPPEWLRAWGARGIPVIGERELAFQQSLCLHVAVTGASGKSTTANLIAQLLRAAGREVEVADATDQPASQLAERTRDLDFLVHAVEPAELEFFEYFRPVVGVLLNAPEDPPESGESGDTQLARMTRLFARQQPFDWAILQSEALARWRAVGAVPAGKHITFSANSRQADLGVDRGLLVSRLEGWVGPLWDMSRAGLRGPHFAEDVLAALAVGRVLRLPLDGMTHALASWRPGPGRMEVLGEVGGVRFVDDSRSATLDALAKTLLALAPHPPEHPFIWVIAGGDTVGRQLYDLGPVLSPRVKQALVLGEAAPAMRAAWSLFTPCSPSSSLLEATKRAISEAVSGDTILYSPACPGGASLMPRELRGRPFRDVVQGGPGGLPGEDALRGSTASPAPPSARSGDA